MQFLRIRSAHVFLGRCGRDRCFSGTGAATVIHRPGNGRRLVNGLGFGEQRLPEEPTLERNHLKQNVALRTAGEPQVVSGVKNNGRHQQRQDDAFYLPEIEKAIGQKLPLTSLEGYC